MQAEQFVMAYGIEQDRIRAMLLSGFASLRPVLRINAEVRDGKSGYIEFNTPVEKGGNRGSNPVYTGARNVSCRV